MLLQVYQHPTFGKILSRTGVKLDPTRSKHWQKCNLKNDIQSFLDILNMLDNRDVWATKIINIGENGMDMESNLPKAISPG